MRIPSRAVTSSLALSLTPLIDLLLLLVLLFSLSSHLARQQNELPLPLPAAQTGKREAGPHRPRLTINLLADGTLRIANRNVKTEELTALLAERRRARGSNLEIRLRADRNLPYSRLEPLLLACSRAGIQNITFATTQQMTNDQ